jgi:hypothetical protein
MIPIYLLYLKFLAECSAQSLSGNSKYSLTERMNRKDLTGSSRLVPHRPKEGLLRVEWSDCPVSPYSQKMDQVIL